MPRTTIYSADCRFCGERETIAVTEGTTDAWAYLDILMDEYICPPCHAGDSKRRELWKRLQSNSTLVWTSG